MNKLYFLLVLLVVLAIALISRWLLTTVETPGTRASTTASHDPDYYMVNVKITVYQPNGKPAYHLDAAHMNHYPDDDTITMQNLNLNSRDEKNLEWNATADKGTAYQNIEVLQLDGNVILKGQGTQPKQIMTIETNSLRIDFPHKRASTQSNVKIFGKNSTITAKGMELDMEAGHLTLSSDARGHYVPN